MDPNTWHFTLSALSQSLAAILGLTGIFIALKLEHIVKEIDYYKRRGISILKVHPSGAKDRVFFSSYYILAKLKAMQDEYADKAEELTPHLRNVLKKYEPNIRVSAERSTHFFEDTIYFLEDYLDQKKKILTTIQIPALITISDIILSLTLLAVSDTIFATFPDTTQLILIGTVAWGIVGIIAIARSSYQLLSSVE